MECQRLRNNWNFVQITYEEELTKIVVTKNITGYIHPESYIEFDLHDNYPFHPPQIIVNGRKYNGANCCDLPEVMQALRALKIYGPDECPCSLSLRHPQRWTPSFYLENLIREIVQVNVLKEKVQLFLNVREISTALNLPREIEEMLLLMI